MHVASTVIVNYCSSLWSELRTAVASSKTQEFTVLSTLSWAQYHQRLRHMTTNRVSKNGTPSIQAQLQASIYISEAWNQKD